ncbi:MAG: hypothetical protein RBR67_00970 [Desulfobacterium sp.]|nr:hypothetical protein [Desulfobacterium sp.]
MFAFYTLFSLVTSFAAFLLFLKQKFPSQSVLFVLLAPVTAPYFFLRANPGSSPWKKTMGVILFYLCFMFVCGVEIHSFSQETGRLTMGGHSPLQKRMLQLSDKLKSSTRAFYLAIRDLESAGTTVSSRSNIDKTTSSIETLRVRMVENKNDVDQFLSFVRHYKASLQNNGFSDSLLIEEFFTDPVVTLHLKSLEAYLAAFESLLNYTFDNFETINSKSNRHLKNYDAYYINYRRAVDRHNLLCLRRIKYQNALLVKHPELKLYLPSMIHTDFLKF